MDFEVVWNKAVKVADDATISEPAFKKVTEGLQDLKPVDEHTISLGRSWLSDDSPLRAHGGALRDAKAIARGDLVELGKSCRESETGFLALFVATYAWGTGYTAYGPYRCAQIMALGIEETRGRLDHAVELLESEGSLSAYFYLNNESEGHLRGYGPAFFSKLLYFAARGSSSAVKPQPLILDKILATSIRRLSSGRLTTPDFGFRTPQYAEYLAFMERLSKAAEVAPDRFEFGVFDVFRPKKMVGSSSSSAC